LSKELERILERLDQVLPPPPPAALTAIGRSAGRSLREVREVRDAFTGKEAPTKDDAAK